jgi:hypothetical protein
MAKPNADFDTKCKNLQSLFTQRLFEDAETLATDLLNSFNAFDYELLLKRAKIRQCLMKYDEALVDAIVALNSHPDRNESYQIVTDCLIAVQKMEEAA